VFRFLPALSLSTRAVVTRDGLTRPTTSPATDDRHPSFSPDATQIVFSSGRQDGRGHLPRLYVMPADGGPATLLYAPPRGAALDPAWSPAPVQ